MLLKWVNYSELVSLFQLPENYQEEENFKYLNFSYINQDNILVALNNQDVILGILQVGESPRSKIYWMKYVCVHPKYRQIGVAKALINEMCNYLSKIENAQIELSTYEKEGEILINSVSEISKQYPELIVRHKVLGGIYQDAKKDFIKAGDEVTFINNLTGEESIGEVLFFEEFFEPVRVRVKTKNESVFSIEMIYVKKNK